MLVVLLVCLAPNLRFLALDCCLFWLSFVFHLFLRFCVTVFYACHSFSRRFRCSNRGGGISSASICFSLGVVNGDIIFCGKIPPASVIVVCKVAVVVAAAGVHSA